MIQNQKNKNRSVRRPAYTSLAFTLVELIVVITILAILGTIAFISLQGYSAQARDSKRLSDISNIKKSLELFSLNTGKYPKPDDKISASYSGETLWYQGTVGDTVATNLSRNLNEKPVDPSTELEYSYSTTYSQTEYEVLCLYESDLISFLPHPNPLLTGEGTRPLIVSSVNAATQDYPKIDGNYNGIYIKTSNFYVPTPSLVNAEILTDTDVKDTTLLKSQIITGGDNLPGVSTGGLDITLSVYEGTITSESTDEEKSNLVEKIQLAYSGSQLSSNTMYADILSKTSTGEMVDFVDVVILNRSSGTTQSQNDDNEEEEEAIILPGNDEYTKLLLHGEGNKGGSTSALTMNGSVQIKSDGKVGHAAYFDGTSEILFAGDSDWNLGTDDFTIDGWMKMDDTGHNSIIDVGNFFSGNSFLAIYESGIGLSFYTDTGHQYNGMGPNLSAGVWYHFAFARKDGTFYSYLDGNLIRSESGNSVSISQGETSGITIGKYSGGNNPMNGYIDELRLVKGEAVYPTDGSSFTPSLVSHSVDENTQLLLDFEGDSSSLEHELTYYGDTQITSDGKFEDAYSFDGNGDYITIPDSDAWDLTGEFTIDFWINFNTTSNPHLIEQTLDSGNRWQFWYTGDSWRFYSAGGVGGAINCEISNSQATGVWTHMALSRDNSNNYKIYKNGILLTSCNSSNSIPILDAPIYIGKYGPSTNYFNGYLDEIRISNGIDRTGDSNDYMYDPNEDGFDVPTQKYGN